MRLKKTLTGLLAALMVLTALPSVSFAETEEEKTTVIPNFMGTAMLDNAACKEFESFAGLKLELTLTSTEDPTKTFTVPLEYNSELESYYAEEYLEQAHVPGMIDDILENQKATLKKYGLDEESLEDEDAAMDALDQLSDLDALSALLMEGVFEGYTVVLNGLAEDSHFKAKLFDGGVQTAADQIAAFEMMLTLFGPEEGFKEGEAPATCKELLDYIAKTSSEGEYDSYEDVLADSGLFGEGEVEALVVLMDKADQYLEAARSGAFPNQLNITMTLMCDCPVVIEYEVFHQYMIEKDGKLEEIALVEDGEPNELGIYYMKGEAGQVVRAKDFLKETYEGELKEYNGKTFDFVGSYDSIAYWDDPESDWSVYELEEYTLSEEYLHSGFVLRYVLHEEQEEVIEEKEKKTEPEQKQETKAKKEKKEPVQIKGNGDEAQKNGESAPLTGDDAPIAIYGGLMATAIAAIVSVLLLKKGRKTNKE